MTDGLWLATSTSWVNIILVFFKFVYIFLCFKMKRHSSSRKSACMLDAKLLKGNFVYFSFNIDWVSRFAVVCSDIVNYVIKVCCILCSWSTKVDWIVGTLFCTRILNFWWSFCSLMDISWELEEDLNGITDEVFCSFYVLSQQIWQSLSCTWDTHRKDKVYSYWTSF